MDRREQRRVAAWAELLGQIEERPAAPPEEAAAQLGRQRRLATRVGEAGTACRTARRALADAREAMVARAPGDDPVQAGLMRAWVDCLDELLALAEQACGQGRSAPATA